MTLQISGQNNVVYRNETSETQRVTIVASGDARAEVRPRAGAAIHHQTFERQGGALSLEVPAGRSLDFVAIPMTGNHRALERG